MSDHWQAKNNIEICNELSEKTWREFVDEHPSGNIFHTPEMYQVFLRTKGHKPKLWAAVDQDGKVLALLSLVQVTLKDGIFRRLTTRSIAYGSVLSETSSSAKEALRFLLRTCGRDERQYSLFTELRNLSDLSHIQAELEACRYNYEEHLNYLIDVNKPIKDIWQSISKSGRRAIEKSIKKGVIAEEIHDRSYIPIFYGLLRKSYQRANIPLADISLFEAVFDILVPKGMAKMLLAKVGNEYVAASLEMPFKDVIYSWYSGYDWSWRSVYPNDHLVWHILEWGSRNGYSYYDFGGAGRSDEAYGVREFKAKYGGRLVNYGRNVFVHSPVTLNISRIGYELYRKTILPLS